MSTPRAGFGEPLSPTEQVDICGDRPDVCAEMGQRLSEWLQSRDLPAGRSSVQPITDAQRQALQQQGYWKLVEEPAKAP